MSGLFSALLTPVGDNGKVDFDQMAKLIDFVLKAGVDGLCLGGATSEFPHLDIAERKELISFAAEEVNGRARLIVAIGASSYFGSLELGRHAAEAGSDLLMLPMPYFFPHSQGDLDYFCRRVAAELNHPMLIYHLPQFTQALTLESILNLVTSEKSIVGIKDSSGDPENQLLLSRARSENGFSLFVGNDSLVLSGLKQGWEGVISGISSCCPELLVSLYSSVRKGHLESADRMNRLLQELIERVSRLPFPWGLKSVLEARGIQAGPRSLPQSEYRLREDRALKEWFAQWIEEQRITRLSGEN